LISFIYNGTPEGAHIGITTKKFNQTEFLIGEGEKEWSFSAAGFLMTSGVEIKDYGSWWNPGDVISIKIDKVLGNLEFFINGNS